MKEYMVYIKSHSPAPDYEKVIYARSKRGAIIKLLDKIGKYGWSYSTLEPHVAEVKDITRFMTK
jgi:hypothetical protein